MTVYAIFNYEVADADAYGRYQAAAGPAFAGRDIKVVAFDTATTALEGTACAHQTVILGFESEEAFHAWYDSPEYRAAIPVRQGATRPTLSILVKGMG